MVKDFVSVVMGNDFWDGWKDKVLYDEYLQHQHIGEDIYRRFVSRDLNWEELAADSYLRTYYDAFRTQAISIPKSITTAEEEEKYRRDKFYDIALATEEQKLYYFALTSGQHTLVVTAPADNKAQKEFLGYDWSNRKGDEGIKIIKPGGMLYNDDDRFARGTIACAIRNSFIDAKTQLPEELQQFAKWYRLKDMVELNNSDFYGIIKLSSLQFEADDSIFPTTKLESILVPITAISKKINKEDIHEHGQYPVVTQEANVLISGYTDEPDPIKNIPLIIFGDHSCSFKFIDFPFFRGADGTQLIKVDEDKANLKYVFYFLSFATIPNRAKYERHFKYLKALQIPLPPMSTQQQIVTECEAEDKVYNENEAAIDSIKSKEANTIATIKGPRVQLREISNFSSERSAYSEILPEAYITTDNMLQNCEGVTDYGGEPNTETVVVYHKGDILLSNIRPYLKKLWFADRDGGCSPDVLVLHVDRDKALPEYVYYSLRRDEFFDYVMSDVKGLKMPRGKKETIERFQFVLPDKDEQLQIVSEMSTMDNDIKKLYLRMQECATIKQAILDKYLK